MAAGATYGWIRKDVKLWSTLMTGHMSNTVEDLLFVKKYAIPPLPRKQSRVQEVWWIPPPRGWTKGNIDGSSHGNPGNSGCGGIFRTSRGFVRGSFAWNIGIETSTVAELCGFIKMIELASLKSWFLLWVKTDSQVLLAKVRSKSKDVPYQLRAKWERALRQLEGKQFSITHIYREGNQVADGLANLACTIDDFIWWYQFPREVASSISRDLVGRPNYRFH
ncbi:hypothetical protein ACHQM5_002248 [Ranunculus cassubicifolius]